MSAPSIQELSTTAYDALLGNLKTRVLESQMHAAASANAQLISLYWQVGTEILNGMEKQGWGAKVIDQLSRDLIAEFPEVKGFSARNLRSMRDFARAYPNFGSGQQLVAQIPWGTNLTILQKIKDPETRLWYVQKTLENGWSRSVLTVQIESNAHERFGKAITNFEQTLPPAQSDLAKEVLKDPYVFDFLTLGLSAKERDLERGLVEHVQQFLLEMGAGFAFVGRQFPLEVGDEDFYLDLLFYHLHLRCFVVVDLKMRRFEPEDAGKMNFYLSAVDSQMRHADDQPTIGLLLCKDNANHIKVEYALRDMSKPIGVAEWQTQLVDSLPKKLRGSLPSIEEIERELSN